jgi:transposase
MGQRSLTDLTAAAWTSLAPLIPAAQRGGRPRPTARRAGVHALCSGRRGGGPGRLLPNAFPPYQTVSQSCWTWRRAGGGERRHDSRRGAGREAAGSTRAPRAGSIESQTGQPPDTGGAGARRAARATAGARAPSSSLAAGCSASSAGLRRGARSVMGPKRCAGHSSPPCRDWHCSGPRGGPPASAARGGRRSGGAPA